MRKVRHGFGDVRFPEPNKVASHNNMEMQTICLEALEQLGWKRTTNIKSDPLPKRMDYHDVYRLARCLETQLIAIQKNLNKSFLFLTEDDIIEIGPGWYMIENNANLVDLERDYITCIKPIEKVKEAPEMAKDLTLPYTTHKSCVYYHIGKMLIKLLDIDDDLELLYGSPLYFTIRRALEPDPTKRHFLLI